MHYTFDDFKVDVAHEVAMLKLHATSDELSRLFPHLLDPMNTRLCYYGLMTGSCHSTRAVDLIKKCARQYVIDCTLTLIAPEGFSRISDHICNGQIDDFDAGRGFSGYYSALEAYALLKEAKNRNIIDFLRDKTSRLNFKTTYKCIHAQTLLPTL